jgi:hypothetical protein
MRLASLNGTRYMWEVIEAGDVRRRLSHAVIYIKQFCGTILEKRLDNGGVRVLDHNM